jgi:hypothetical protein
MADLLARELDWSRGHVAAVLNGCAFAPSLLTFWFVNGVVDFSTAVAVGAAAGPGGLAVRLVAYVLLVPSFVALRVAYYLAHPVHRETVLAGACPQSDLLSLDWFSVGILATGLPLALADLGPWVGMNTVFVLGLFGLPRVLPEHARDPVRLGAVGAGVALFAYARYGAAFAGATPVPSPAWLGPVASLRLSAGAVGLLFALANGLLTGPLFVAGFALATNAVLGREELSCIPLVRHTVPDPDPVRAVATSAALGTVFYLLVVAAATGRLVVLP